MKLKMSKLIQLALICFSSLGAMSIVNEVQNVDDKKKSFDTKQGHLNDPVGYNFVKSWYFDQQPKTNFNIEISLDSSVYNYLRLWLIARIRKFIPFSISEKTTQDFVTSFVTGTTQFDNFTPELKSITKQLQLKLEEKSEAMSLRKNFFQDSLSNWLTTLNGFAYFVSAFTMNFIKLKDEKIDYYPTKNLLWKYDDGTIARDSTSEKINNYYRQEGMCIELPFVETTGDFWEVDETNLRTFPQETKNSSVNHYYLQDFDPEIKGPMIYIESKSTEEVYVRDVLAKILTAIQKNFGLQIKDMDYIRIASKDFNVIIPTNKRVKPAIVSIDFLNIYRVKQTYISLPILLARYAPSFEHGNKSGQICKL